MTRRILATGMAGAALYAAILGAAAPAQAPTPTPTVEAVATPITTPAPTAASTPVETATPTATADPTPFPSPVETTVATPDPTATATPGKTPTATPGKTPDPTATATPGETPTATATPEKTPDATATPDGKGLTVDHTRPKRKSARKEGGKTRPERARSCEGRGRLVADSSGSTSGRECADESDESGDAHRDEVKAIEKKLAEPPTLERADGSPAPTNPTYAVAIPGPARIGVPNFFIDKFRIPPFLLPIYQAAGMQYGVRWEILAAINEIETDYGRNLNISSAGALGWMQFMPPTWKAYGVDANRDGLKDPYNPVDAIFAAARYLSAAGADTDIRKAVFAYNHADWYVDSVLMRAQVIGGLPADLVGSLTGLTQGRFPIQAKASYAGQLEHKGRKVRSGNAAMVVEADDTRRDIDIFSRAKAPVVAVNDGRIKEVGAHRVVLQDVYGNTFTYRRLAKVAATIPVPKKRTRKNGDAPRLERDAQKPSAPATDAPVRKTAPRKPAAPQPAAAPRPAAAPKAKATAPKAKAAARKAAWAGAPLDKERLFANPARPAARSAGGVVQLKSAAAEEPVKAEKATVRAPLGFDKRDFHSKPLVEGARVIGGTVLGRIGKGRDGQAPRLTFEIRPAGRGAPKIDPKPILDGWKLLESTAVYRAARKNPFFGDDAENPSIGQLMLMSKEQLVRRVLAEERIEIYGCGRSDIRSGQIDRRVLATLMYLTANGLKPTVTSLKCGHGYYTASGNVSHHSTGSAVDIAAINGIVITPATQGPGSITDLTIQRLLSLQGTMKPSQIISLMTFDNADNTYAMGDHDDHIHVGFAPLYGDSRKVARQIDAVLKPSQWIKLIGRISDIDNPTVDEQPSKFSVAVVKQPRRGRGRR